MKRLKIVLQCNWLFYIIFVISLLYSFIRIGIGYSSKIEVNDVVVGKVIEIVKKDSTNKLVINGKEKVIVYYNDIGNIELGDVLEVSGEYSTIKENTIFNNFNYKSYLYNKRIFHVIYADRVNIIKKNKNVVYFLKNYIINRSDSFSNNGYIKAFIIGDKNDLDAYSMFQENGISHLFALSGMHISLLSMLLYKLFDKCRYKELIVISFLLFYVTLTNLSASILRTIVFFIILKVNKRYDLNMSTKNSLLLTVSLIIMYNPLIIYDIGFLYSAVVTYGLIISTKYYKKNYFINLLLTSSIALLFSLPITLYNNYELNIMSILNNLINVPLVTYVIYPLSLLTFIFRFLEPIYNLSILVLEGINGLTSLLNLNIVIPKVSILFYLLYYFFILLFIKSNNIKYIMLSILLVLSFKFIPLLNPYYNIYFVDVGQGDSSLITYRNNVVMIDTGGIRNKTVSDGSIRLLKSLGYSKINYLIITHGDYDHMGDAINIINSIRVDKVVFNCGKHNELESNLIDVLDRKKIPYYSCINKLSINSSKLYFLNNGKYDNENDNSSVVYSQIGSYKFLFMGDAGIEVEKDIINNYNLSNIDVLKVGHHGSKTSSGSDFISVINPRFSIISVGENNRYGHPNNSVLDNLSSSRIYRTDLNGSVVFRVKNSRLSVKTCET